MKKLMVMLCTGTLMLAMAACGNKDDGTAESTQQSTTGGVESTETQTQATPAPETTEQDMDTAEGWSEEMTAVRDAVVEALGENYWPNSKITAEMLEGTFGVTSDMYEDYMGEMPMISTNVDTLLIIKAKSDKVDEVEEAINAYRDNLVNDTMQYPMNIGKIQASRIEKIGDYICFVQLGADTTQALESGDEAVITHCQEQNELVIEVIGRNVQR